MAKEKKKSTQALKVGKKMVRLMNKWFFSLAFPCHSNYSISWYHTTTATALAAYGSIIEFYDIGTICFVCIAEFPFEFRALEVVLEAICSFLDARTRELESDVYPALDELTSKVKRFFNELSFLLLQRHLIWWLYVVPNLNGYFSVRTSNEIRSACSK